MTIPSSGVASNTPSVAGIGFPTGRRSGDRGGRRGRGRARRHDRTGSEGRSESQDPDNHGDDHGATGSHGQLTDPPPTTTEVEDVLIGVLVERQMLGGVVELASETVFDLHGAIPSRLVRSSAIARWRRLFTVPGRICSARATSSVLQSM